MCGSDLRRGHNGDRCFSSILFKYKRSMSHLFVLGWARVRRVAYGGVYVFHVCLDVGVVVGVSVNVCDIVLCCMLFVSDVWVLFGVL